MSDDSMMTRATMLRRELISKVSPTGDIQESQLHILAFSSNCASLLLFRLLQAARTSRLNLPKMSQNTAHCGARLTSNLAGHRVH